MNEAAPHRTKLTVLVALFAALVVAGLVVGAARVEEVVPRLPTVPGGRATLAVIAVAALVCAILILVRLARAGRCRARRRALEASVRGQVSCGIRTSMLVSALNEVRVDEPHAIRLAARYSMVADELGVAFWNGGHRPRRAVFFPWREVRNIRADSMVIGGTLVSVLVLRVRRGGTSAELPIVFSAPRVGAYALGDAPFYALVRSWKALHREALKAEGIEPPPVTGAIPVIRPGMAYAGAR
ncbi:hypothetical protein MUN74_08150 [Agromyces endophyticus]|uniref:hypothetical protein n=1 Tax=Agromyces sp. H17E-10 TaxID=2932244 RepID=UPI001FCF9BBA|nr:hypothetical protein [Agromyces sp. H17E-10]UOQ90858.1 hypothetical protein MUN74_08150 [Agromyces sp. H17E-10]